MTPLTKLFVCLVVVLSLLQTAATVVFVNRVEIAGNNVTSLEQTVQSNEAKITSLQAQLAEATAQKDTIRSQSQAAVAASEQQAVSTRQALADANVKLAQAASQLALQATDNARLTEALKASEDTKNKQVDIITEARRFVDDLTRRVTELNAANADLTNRLEVTERERRFLQEQNVELQSRVATGGGTTSTGSGAVTAAGRGVPSINAVVRNVRTIANTPYASISVGSADRVTKGMRFTIVDQQGNLLGFLTVDTVEPNEAAGRLDGPRVPDIQPGVDAKTQL